MKLTLMLGSAFSLDTYTADSFLAFYKEKVYPDVLRVDEKPAEYFSLPSSQNLTQFTSCVHNFLNEQWSAADLCLSDLKYRTVEKL